MKKIATAGFVVALLTVAAILPAQDESKKSTSESVMKMPEPQKEHEWLQQFVGEWDADIEMYMEPGKPPQKQKGTESTRSIGGFWVLAENKGTFMDKPFTGFMTLGYDPEKKKYVGTWIDSMNSYLWKYEGTVNEGGKVLTLNTEGPCPKAPGKLSKFKEVVEFKSKDHRVFTSSIQDDDGKWSTVMNINYRRKG
jgi:hypothetical protein